MQHAQSDASRSRLRAGRARGNFFQPHERARAGQASMELIAILGISFIVILFFVINASDIFSAIGAQQDYREASESVRLLAEEADHVYAQGDGATGMVFVTLPPSTDFGANSTYIGKPSSAPAGATPNAINIRLGNSDVTAYTRAPLSGAFPSPFGKYTLRVASHGSYVSIGPNLLDIKGSSVSASMGRSQTASAYLNFSIVADQDAVVNITSQWGYSSPTLSIAPTSFSGYGGANATVELNFTSDSNDAGIYSSELNVTVYKVGNPSVRETFKIPVTAEVYAG